MSTTQWRLFAHEIRGTYFHFGSRFFVEIHQMSHPIVEVDLIVDPEGRYWGWLRTGTDTPTMIWPTRMQFDMCFPYGAQAEEARGHGQVLRFRAMPVGGGDEPDR